MDLRETDATNRIDELKPLDETGRPSFALPAEASSRGVMVVDANDRVIYADVRLCDLLGVTQGDLLGKPRADAVRNVLAPRFANPDKYESACRNSQEHPDEVVEEVLELAGPVHRVVHRYSAPLFDNPDGRRGRLEVYSDITLRRQLEAGIRRAYEELRATQDQQVQTEKLRAIGEIASGVAHDFNNTLGIILGNVQLLLRMVSDEKATAKLLAAERAVMDGAETVRRIREFTSMSPLAPSTTVNLSILVSEVVEMMRPTFRPACDIQMDLAERAPATGTGPEIREVLTNVLMNAVQAMPDGGTIRIATGSTKSSSWVRISDTGVGMTEEVRNRIFDPFFTTRGVAGTGLGMSVAYGVVRRHGGRIAVESSPGKGASVTVFLPASTGGLADVPELPREVLVSAEPASILVVDDEEMFADVIVEMLTEIGHAVCVARSGSDALEQFKDNKFDLVFTDLGMPEMSGTELAKLIKDIRPATPIVLLTGWGASLDESDKDGADVDIVLAKPIRFEKLSSVVADALGKRR